jgi:hypothetical protein
MAPFYQYQPLSSPSTQIRLLELLPGRGILQCRLEVADLREVVDTYEPISYCWKTHTQKHWLASTYKEKKKQKTFRIRIDGADFCITESLRSALRQMRLRTEIRVLWADAICINQANDDEKSAQVAMMGNIYQSGKQTLVWLGNADCWTARAFRQLRQVLLGIPEDSESDDTSGETMDEPGHSESSHGTLAVAKTRGLRHLLSVRRLSQSFLKHNAYLSIYTRPYFRRLWVVQEFVLSAHVVVMCGKHEITGDELYQAYYEIVRDPFSARDWITDSFACLWNDPELYCLNEIICRLLPMESSDPRDKLFGTLGLHQNCETYETLVVDYTKDVDDVFLDATKLLLSPFLDLLSISYGASRPNRKHVPSWVWNPEPRYIVRPFSQAHESIYPFQASRGWNSQPQFRGRILGLLGYVIADVKAVGEAFPAGVGPQDPSNPYLFKAISCYFSWVEVSGMYERGITEAEQKGRMDAFRCTLKPFKEFFSGSNRWYSNWNDEIDREEFNSFHKEIYRRFRKLFSPGAKRLGIMARLRLWVAIASLSASIYSSDTTSWMNYAYWQLTAVWNRRFVKTRGGWYGLCPRDTMPNDKIVLLQGGTVPIVLRPSGERWVLVGECFLDGAMYGELWDQERCQMLWIE